MQVLFLSLYTTWRMRIFHFSFSPYLIQFKLSSWKKLLKLGFFVRVCWVTCKKIQSFIWAIQKSSLIFQFSRSRVNFSFPDFPLVHAGLIFPRFTSDIFQTSLLFAAGNLVLNVKVWTLRFLLFYSDHNIARWMNNNSELFYINFIRISLIIRIRVICKANKIHKR